MVKHACTTYYPERLSLTAQDTCVRPSVFIQKGLCQVLGVDG